MDEKVVKMKTEINSIDDDESSGKTARDAFEKIINQTNEIDNLLVKLCSDLKLPEPEKEDRIDLLTLKIIEKLAGMMGSDKQWIEPTNVTDHFNDIARED